MAVIDWTPITDAHPLCRMSAKDLRDAYAAGEISPVEVAKAALDRAEAIQPLYNAFTRIEHEAALAQAEASEQRWRAGAPLSEVDGVPATIKDIVWVEGWPIRYGSTATAATPPCKADAPAVARMRAAGITFLGLTTTPEFGWKALTDSPFSGVTRNPWNRELTPGGSSGGAAAAAAAGAGVFHIGTDGGGSIRVPSSFTGIVGLKPTFGRVPAYPPSPFGTLAHIGPMARRVDDVRAMLAAMAGIDPTDWLQGPATFAGLDGRPRVFAGAKIGFWSKPPCGTVDPEIAAVMDGVMRDLARLGAEVTPIDLPEGDPLKTFNTLWYGGAAARAAPLPTEARAGLDPGLKAIVAEGERIDAVRYIQALGERAEFGRQMEALAARFDLILSPGAAVLPFPVGLEVPPESGLGRWIEWAGFSFPINLSQQPAAIVPCGHSASGLPVALQIIAPRGEDGRVLAFAKAFETEFPPAHA